MAHLDLDLARLRTTLPDRSTDLLAALRVAIPHEKIDAALVATGRREKRRRRLPSDLVIALVIAMSLWAQNSLRQVFANLMDGWWESQQTGQPCVPAKSALTKARQRVGPQPLLALFRLLARPVATPETIPQAFLGGLRLMAIDGTALDIPDSPANARVFGRITAGRGTAAFPAVQVMSLLELGTHVLCDATLRPCRHNEAPVGRQLLRSVGPGMLLLWDRAFHSYEMVQQTLARGAHFLGRVPSPVRFAAEQVLADGSSLRTIHARQRKGLPTPPPIRVRIIEYTIDDPDRPHHGERQRLMTSLLDWQAFPALTLATLYHERWEIETATDEMKTHQNARAVEIRSQRPREVVQEVYGLLIAHLAIRIMMACAATTRGIDPDRLSFTGAICIIRRAVPRFQRAQKDMSPLCSLISWLNWRVRSIRPARTESIRGSYGAQACRIA